MEEIRGKEKRGKSRREMEEVEGNDDEGKILQESERNLNGFIRGFGSYCRPQLVLIL